MTKVIRRHQGGSGARVYECARGEDTLLAKIATRNAGHKLLLESEWLRHYGETFRAPAVRVVLRRGSLVRMELDFIEGGRSLESEISVRSHEDVLGILFEIVEAVQALPAEPEPRPLKDLVSACWSDYIYGKTEKVPHVSFSSFLRSMTRIVDSMRAAYERAPLARRAIHGDITAENIMIGPTGWQLVDPNPRNIFSDLAVDVGKIYQSFHGQYEQIRRARGRSGWTPCPRKQKIFEAFEGELRSRYGGDFVTQTRAHEIIHFLRLLPYRYQSEPELMPFFLERLRWLIDDFHRVV